MSHTVRQDEGTPAGFGARLQQSVTARGRLLVGIDPHASQLEGWGLPDTAEGLRTFSLRVLESCAADACAIKPQSAFYERHGSAGIAVLEELLAAARERGVLSILDVKRGDIGSTMGAYADAYLRPGAPLEADAITVSPYLGWGSLDPALRYVEEEGKGLFVLALTSNPDGPEVQHARDDRGRAVARTMTGHAAAFNARTVPEPGTWGNVGLVVGGTIGPAARELGIDLDAVRGALLSPGFGAQGAGPAQLTEVFAQAADRVLVSVSRGLLGAGPEVSNLALAAKKLASAYR
jgi:orotidine-5'-phosphate decarboxylase